MPNTGHFLVLAADLVTDDRGFVEAIRSVTVRCHRCGTVNHAAGLSPSAACGRVELRCSGCGACQSVSYARFECEYLQARGRTSCDWFA
ncbi:Com family DNA-binding transcriptional regulator [Stenotrophomonas maltophilia]|uniref:Com family DNA-binding transcriptional regulator n=1 Tax=Stenotrophomonas maltophilia TaxID=40324 RepID=UPI003CE485BB